MKYPLIWLSSLVFLLWSCSEKKIKSEKKSEKSLETTSENENLTLVSIKIQLQNPQKNVVRLQKLQKGVYQTIDSLDTSNKKLDFETKIEQTDFFQLQFADGLTIPLVLNPKETQVKVMIGNQGAENKYEIVGSNDTMYYLTLNNIFTSFRNQIADLQQKKQQKGITPQEIKVVDAEYTSFQEKGITKLKALIDSIKPSVVGLIALRGLEANEHFEYIGEVLAYYQKNLAKSRYTQQFTKEWAQISQQYEAKSSLQIGKLAPDIALKNPAGQEIKLSSLRGKVVLIDFWASWCKPCRMENPQVVRIYQKYKNRGFEIYSVSLDKDKKAWEKAIEDDKLTWKHVSELNFWQSEVVKTYSIQGIPLTYLLDKEGKILASNLRGTELDDKVGEALSQN